MLRHHACCWRISSAASCSSGPACSPSAAPRAPLATPALAAAPAGSTAPAATRPRAYRGKAGAAAWPAGAGRFRRRGWGGNGRWGSCAVSEAQGRLFGVTVYVLTMVGHLKNVSPAFALMPNRITNVEFTTISSTIANTMLAEVLFYQPALSLRFFITSKIISLKSSSIKFAQILL